MFVLKIFGLIIKQLQIILYLFLIKCCFYQDKVHLCSTINKQNTHIMKATKELTAKQAIKLAKKQFIEEHGKRAYNAHISICPRYAGGRYVHIMASGLSTEFYFN